MHKFILTAAIVVLPLFAATPSFAINGLDAARSCEAQKSRCRTSYGEDGSVQLMIDGRIIDCPSAMSECKMAIIVHGRGVGPVSNSESGMISHDDDNDDGDTGGGHDGGHVMGGTVGAFADTNTTDVGGGIIQ